ncbi:MAG: secondary thiamine-phosphate synthase enzyme YjbQ [Candidatus Hodarchaeaceae archaeon]|nr:secondary thiamine-phosphate synthase enzyme YjbQ [Candidatus Hodarchaeaceae archaeon]MDI6884653.1 secondary thiamine-phosphate synthase enzyme YjbQ [Hadesarchaea archaeon]
MRTWSKELSFSTRKHREIVDITDEVLAAARESGIKNGLLIAQLPHATASLVLNEGESGLKQDLLDKLEDLVPLRGDYKHDRIDDNAHAHLKSAFLGSSRVLPIVDGRVARGTWQNFLVIEEDGPRTRRLVIFVMGE